jgi:hypothetical protein
MKYDRAEHQRWLESLASRSGPAETAPEQPSAAAYPWDVSAADPTAHHARVLRRAMFPDEEEPLPPIDPVARAQFLARANAELARLVPPSPHPKPGEALGPSRVAWLSRLASGPMPRVATAVLVLMVVGSFTAMQMTIKASKSAAVAQPLYAENPEAQVRMLQEELTALGVTVSHPDPAYNLLLEIRTPMPPSAALTTLLARHHLPQPTTQPPQHVLERVLQGVGLSQPEGRLVLEVMRKPPQ